MEGRTKLLLGILAVLLAIAAWRYLGPKDDAPAAPGRTLGVAADPESLSDPVPGQRPARRSGEKKVDSIEELRVADLRIRARDYTPGRDPWRFVEPPPPPPPPPPQPPQGGPSPEELERMRQAQEELARQRAAELARQQAEEAARTPPPFTMAYLGSFGPAERRIAVFSDGASIINAQEGEVIGGKFIVAHIGYESVDIQAVGYPDAPPQRLAVGRPSPSR
ncbi:MAG TPA: hypothetical protein VF756_24330 [Thermoanaerobaculia bacterium]